MRVRPDHAGVDERRALARAHVGGRLAHHAQAGEEIGAVDRRDVQAGKRRQQPRDVAARRLDFHGHRDGVAVVFDQKEDRQARRMQAVLSDSQNSPSLVAPSPERHVDDLVALESASRDPESRRRARRSRPLRRRRRRAAPGVAVALDPGTIFSARWPQCDGIWRPPLLGSAAAPTDGEQHLERRDAELQAQRAIAIVGMEPVVAGLEREAGGDQHRFVTGAADLEEGAALVLELDLLVVETLASAPSRGRRRAAPRGRDRDRRRRPPDRPARSRGLRR